MISFAATTFAREPSLIRLRSGMMISMRPFHLAMMKAPALLHATVLKVEDEFAAPHFRTYSNKEVQMGIIAHNPFLGKYLPGKLSSFRLRG